MVAGTRTILVLIFILALIVRVSYGQPCEGPDCGGDVDQAPLTGVEWLIGAGIILGFKNFIKKVWKRHE